VSFANSYEDARQSLIEPLDYSSLVHLMKRSTLILDRLGGGIQEEKLDHHHEVLQK
jgi:UDP-N-acetylglucosamine 2-epimerase